MWGSRFCKDIIREILKQKIIKLKLDNKKKLQTKVFAPGFKQITGREIPEEIESNIKRYLGGKKRRTKKISKRTRKSKRKISKKKTKRRRSKYN